MQVTCCCILKKVNKNHRGFVQKTASVVFYGKVKGNKDEKNCGLPHSINVLLNIPEFLSRELLHFKQNQVRDEREHHRRKRA